jgi:hypothetical protein
MMIDCAGKEMENVILGCGLRLQKKHPVTVQFILNARWTILE